VAEIERLMGDTAKRRGRWNDLHRHFRFGEGHDWHDIYEFDWPSVRADVEAAGFADTDPPPVPDIDLGEAAGGCLMGSVRFSQRIGRSALVKTSAAAVMAPMR
jgi:hypothetical protein